MVASSLLLYHITFSNLPTCNNKFVYLTELPAYTGTALSYYLYRHK
jgi:hypothetical protein